MSLASRLKELRSLKGISQAALAKAIGVSSGNVGDWERGRVKPGTDALISLARFFGVTIDWLVMGAEGSLFNQRTDQSDSDHLENLINSELVLLMSQLNLLSVDQSLTIRSSFQSFLDIISRKINSPDFDQEYYDLVSDIMFGFQRYVDVLHMDLDKKERPERSYKNVSLHLREIRNDLYKLSELILNHGREDGAEDPNYNNFIFNNDEIDLISKYRSLPMDEKSELMSIVNLKIQKQARQHKGGSSASNNGGTNVNNNSGGATA